MRLKEPNSKLVRWRLKLEEFDYEIHNKKVKCNTNADALSRIKPVPNVDVNINESTESNSDNETVHSALSDDTNEIRISSQAINVFHNQIILEIDPRYDNLHYSISKIFQSKTRHTFLKNCYNPHDFIQIFKEY